MPADVTELVDRPGFYRAEADEQGPRYRRALLAPVGADAPVYLPPVQQDPFALLGAPEPFPLEWLERPPAWLSPGEDVRVCTTGKDLGRVAGYIRLHDTCFQDGTSKCRMPPEVPLDEFHHSRLPVIDKDGQRFDALGGVISLAGGHSDRPSVAAKTAAEAKEWAQRPEWAKLRGVIVRDEIGDLFLGAARPDLTLAEANIVNQSHTSGEWWPLYEPGPDGKPRLTGSGADLIGVVLVASGAFRKRQPEAFRRIAAAIGAAEPTWEEILEELAVAPRPGEGFLCGYCNGATGHAETCHLAGGCEECDAGPGDECAAVCPSRAPVLAAPAEGRPGPAEGATGGLGGLAGLVAAEVARQLAAHGRPLLAAVDLADHESRIDALESGLESVRAAHDDLEGRFTAFQIELTGEIALTLPEAVAGTQDDVDELRERMEEIALELERRPGAFELGGDGDNDGSVAGDVPLDALAR